MDALAILMRDPLPQNYALRRENTELMDQVRRLLCEKANLLAQVRPHFLPPFSLASSLIAEAALIPSFFWVVAEYPTLDKDRLWPNYLLFPPTQKLLHDFTCLVTLPSKNELSPHCPSKVQKAASD